MTPDQQLDPITLEVIRNRLRSICDEMFIVVKRTAASPIYTESNDYSLAILDDSGRILCISGTAAFHLVSAKSVVTETIRTMADDPGIDAGDIVIANDAYAAGGIHSMDIGVVTPVFHDGEQVAWAGCVAQQMDIGGMTPGGFHLEATECYQEGLRFPPMKLYERGRLRRDLWSFYRNNVRLADKQTIDMMGQVSAVRIGEQRLRELCEEVGVATFRAACQALIRMAEDRLREKIRQIPDGVYEHVDYEEHDTRTHAFLRIRCRLTVAGDQMTFDFAGTVPQVQGPINATEIGMQAGVYAALIPALAWDMPWTDGLLRPITITAPPGTIVSCQVPAPVSMCMTMFRAAEAAQACLSKALALSPFVERANAAWMGMWPVIVGQGCDQYGHPCLIPWMDAGPGGGGAWAALDGVDNAAMICTLSANVASIEWSETYYPFLFLERSIVCDSEGAGQFRGGVGIQVVATPYHTERLHFINAQTRKYFAGFTMGGGYPGGQHTQRIKRGSDLFACLADGTLPRWDQIGAETVEMLDPKCRFTMVPGDVIRFTGGGGSGYGDPIARDPARVATDVQWGYVSAGKAQAVYGVVVDPKTSAVDETATAASRRAIRWSRLSGIQADGPASGANGGAAGSAESLVVVRVNGGATLQCSRCRHELSALRDNWKNHAVHRQSSLAAAHADIPEHERVVFHQFFCPKCATALGAEINLCGEPLTHDFCLAGG